MNARYRVVPCPSSRKIKPRPSYRCSPANPKRAHNNRSFSEYSVIRKKPLVRSLAPPMGDGRTLAASLLQAFSPPPSPAVAAGVVHRAFPVVLAAAGRPFPVCAEGGAGPPDGDGAVWRRRPGSADWVPRAGGLRCGGVVVDCGAAWWCWWPTAPARPKSGPIWAPSGSGRAGWTSRGGELGGTSGSG
jgi:hypothetical protein